LRGKAVIEREFEPQLDEQAKEKLYAGWKKAVSRTRDWEPHEDAE
jgi:glycerol kinase